MKNCGTCFWCYTQEDEDYERREKMLMGTYQDDEKNMSHGGDCSLEVENKDFPTACRYYRDLENGLNKEEEEILRNLIHGNISNEEFVRKLRKKTDY